MREAIFVAYNRPDGTQFLGQGHRSVEHANNGIAHTFMHSGAIAAYVIKARLKAPNPYYINLNPKKGLH
jgi:hypothetical protein